jgi:pimeloyl-ACP methyl ester carboxylesterase
MTSSTTTPETLDAPDGVSIAYHRFRGKSPGVVFMGGFMSDMTGTKAMRLEEFCRKRGQAYLRFDYRGHGASSGRFEDGTIGRWKRPERVAGLVGIAAAPDFTEDLMWDVFPPEKREQMARDGIVHEPSEYSEKPYGITMALIEDGRRHLLLRGQPLPLTCKVRLLHGMQDPDVPWQRSLTLAEKLAAGDVRVVLIKDGDHRLSREQDLALLCDTIGELLNG